MTTASSAAGRFAFAPARPSVSAAPDRSACLAQEEALLSALLADPDVFALIADTVSWRDFSSYAEDRTAGRCRKAIAEAIWACGIATPPLVVNKPNVIGQLQRLGYLDERAHTDYVQWLDDKGTADIVRGAQDYAARIETLSRARRMYRLVVEVADQLATSPDEVDSTGTLLLEKAADLLRGGVLARDPTLGAIRQNAPEDTPYIPTALVALDRLARIWKAGGVTAILARQGGRKTSSALNLILTPLFQGKSIDYFSFRDNSREEIRAQLIAMRATLWMRHWHERGERQDCPPETWVLSPEGLYTRFRLPGQQAAITKAEREFDDLSQNMRIYDKVDGIIDYGTTQLITRRSHAKFGTQMVVYDYMQGMEVPGADDDYKTMKVAAKGLHRIVGERGIACVMLSQVNKDDDIRGGGDLRDAATVIIRVGYSPARPDALTFEIDKGRFSSLLEPFFTYCINPASGVILNPRATAGVQNRGETV